MKIPRPKPPETEFKRKRAPPPQATKLLVASLSAGLVFMALLAIVFVPRYLDNLNPPPSTLVSLELAPRVPQLNVTFALYNLNVSKFNVTLTRDNVTVASLPPGLGGANGGLSFTDANHDGLLDAGDFFTLPSGPQGTYRFAVWQGDVSHLVGVVSWTGSLP